MKRVEAARRYDVPVERAFAFITDTANWPRFWPGYVRLEEGSSWAGAGDTARLVTRVLGREWLLTMTITAFERNWLVTYSSVQPGLPTASHERHFEPDGEGFVYRLVVEYEPRGGFAGVFDRLVLARAVRRAFEQTFVAGPRVRVFSERLENLPPRPRATRANRGQILQCSVRVTILRQLRAESGTSRANVAMQDLTPDGPARGGLLGPPSRASPAARSDRVTARPRITSTSRWPSGTTSRWRRCSSLPPSTPWSTSSPSSRARGLRSSLGSGPAASPCPLVRRGVKVQGIELSSAMVARLRAKPGAERIEVSRRSST
jgi:hypothetical protein